MLELLEQEHEVLRVHFGQDTGRVSAHLFQQLET
jgi:hypothetical protein